MKTTYDPELIYDMFDRYGFPVLRIDCFDRGNYAEIRASLECDGPITVDQLQEITTKLKLIQKKEDVGLKIVHIDLKHKTIRINIYTKTD